jgi:hypothetical protein
MMLSGPDRKLVTAPNLHSCRFLPFSSVPPNQILSSLIVRVGLDCNPGVLSFEFRAICCSGRTCRTISSSPSHASHPNVVPTAGGLLNWMRTSIKFSSTALPARHRRVCFGHCFDRNIFPNHDVLACLRWTCTDPR